MSARPARATLGTDEEEGIVAEGTVLVSPFLAKAFGLDEASFAAPSDRTAGNSSGDASGSLGSGAGGRGGGALRHTSPLGIVPAPRGLLGGAGDAPDASELRATLAGAAGARSCAFGRGARHLACRPVLCDSSRPHCRATALLRAPAAAPRVCGSRAAAPRVARAEGARRGGLGRDTCSHTVIC
jgi:hypothetical protein